MRYFIRFSYFGKAYHGWQRQPNAISVQEILENAMSTLLRAPVEIVGAGRTDAGVHAREMYAHFDFDGAIDSKELVQRLNSFLPDDIAIQDIVRTSNDAHARFDASERTYEYWIVQQKDPFFTDFAHHVWQPLQISKMNEAAALLLEHEDFECFSKSNTDVKTFICDVRKAVWTKEENKWVFAITADRFLRNMVRAVVGTLLEVGLGKQEPVGINKIIESKSRSEAGVSVPAKGLYLTHILYPNSIFDEQE
ncbi:tRNA pseudouridine(38-40) synthase TruA [Flagellimonas allohymeniacidonis]|uniref:tRNA pseudouridine synthase A n=1 Tax=Flagellimonas allohymeniacidonis TaxID=2517819 RepID=A0A4Q8QJK7_9FLAO|nr:tRNA pseudouridine(38-40) synthase TruA [Allomuricauda hymeniacidonis]TAI49508.1 tRNA pseudouridine(38-40) synthase TruA [Allomuricauda hymeniacidonis]